MFKNGQNSSILYCVLRKLNPACCVAAYASFGAKGLNFSFIKIGRRKVTLPEGLPVPL
jgi:hypothetical protein